MAAWLESQGHAVNRKRVHRIDAADGTGHQPAYLLVQFGKLTLTEFVGPAHAGTRQEDRLAI
jgi:hypothetical protein